MDTYNPEDLFEDRDTPFNVSLSGKYKRSFAYEVIKDRMPVILTKIIDSLCVNRQELAKKYGQGALEDAKQLIGFISQLKNEITTNKPIRPLCLNTEDAADAEEWNKYLESKTLSTDEEPTWFNTEWIYCECYMYRVLAHEIGTTFVMHKYDPFERVKKDVFTNSLESVNALVSYMANICCNNTTKHDEETLKTELSTLIKLSLWGNRIDLSASAGAPCSEIGNPLDLIKSLDNNILVNELEYILPIIKEDMGDYNNIHIVLDNAGYELFTDLCLAAYLVSYTSINKITFHVKRYPWYVSDTTIHDFIWLLEYMNTLELYPKIKSLGEVFNKYLKSGTWCIKEEFYWTAPYGDYRNMKRDDPKLYHEFSKSKLVIFKGDLNYRKLLGDINFNYHEKLMNVFGEFAPTNMLALRTLKSDICVGLPPGMAELLFKEDKDWMKIGKYGIIQTALNPLIRDSVPFCLKSA